MIKLSMSNYDSNSVAIIILIGGKSTRFGKDKGLFEFNGKPLISYQLDTLKQGNYDIFLVAHSSEQVQNYVDNIDISQIMAFIIDADFLISDSNKRTPLLGIYSGFKELQNLGYQKSLVIPCDIPLINLDVVKLIIRESYEYDCCIPSWENHLLEPLFAVYSIEKTLIKAEKNLKEENYKLINLLDDDWKINYLSIEKIISSIDNELFSFININKQPDLKKLKKKIDFSKNF